MLSLHFKCNIKRRLGGRQGRYPSGGRAVPFLQRGGRAVPFLQRGGARPGPPPTSGPPPRGGRGEGEDRVLPPRGEGSGGGRSASRSAARRGGDGTDRAGSGRRAGRPGPGAEI